MLIVLFSIYFEQYNWFSLIRLALLETLFELLLFSKIVCKLGPSKRTKWPTYFKFSYALGLFIWARNITLTGQYWLVQEQFQAW